MTIQLIALSGFLGLPHDWNFLNLQELIAIDWQDFEWDSLTDWAKQFNKKVTDNQHLFPSLKKNIIMGYSLGGRLALHALINSPQLWQGAIIISAHPGLQTQQEKDKRLLRDHVWAKYFLQRPWSELMENWNKQSVFKYDQCVLNRPEKYYKRETLVKALLNGSLGKQENLRSSISNLPMPILWVTGSYDTCYCQIADSLLFSNPLSCALQVEKAGHRAPWCNKKAFSKLINRALLNFGDTYTQQSIYTK